MTPTPQSTDLAVAAARAAADKHATDVVVLDVRQTIVITDHFVICTADNPRQVKTVIEAVEEALRPLGERPVRREGESDAGWSLLDYIDVVVHVFAPEQRAYYDLERLWRDAPKVAWEPPARAAAGG
jgi:ribosome-associated protein